MEVELDYEVVMNTYYHGRLGPPRPKGMVSSLLADCKELICHRTTIKVSYVSMEGNRFVDFILSILSSRVTGICWCSIDH